jgi:tRNA(Ile)-lysidine synthase TilS/MesJ
MVAGKVCFVSVSGGKDSTLTLALAVEKYRGTGIPVVAVFCDTG